ncbi:hypothetical protein [Vibrio aphrogenes]|uniref:hypothetical protein n=1 Tax=Vibrio aphrogenes TaxID=1891186 RepID=UPI000B354E84|nr:hypothetical protein [Vibrio aphrogenes]
MNTFKLIPLLAMIPMLASANVVLKSDGDNLLVNDKPTQLVKHLYDANGNQLSNVQILADEATEVQALVSFDGQAGLFEIRATGYSQAQTNDAPKIYSANCDVIGVGPVSFYPLGYLAEGAINIGESANYSVSKLGASVSGYAENDAFQSLDRDPDTWEVTSGQDCTVGTPMTGNALIADSALTQSVNTFFNNLKFPLSIK